MTERLKKLLAKTKKQLALATSDDDVALFEQNIKSLKSFLKRTQKEIKKPKPIKPKNKKELERLDRKVGDPLEIGPKKLYVFAISNEGCIPENLS